MKLKNKPGINWFYEQNRLRVRKELNKIKNHKIPKSVIKLFIIWAARQRINYESNINEEINQYLKEVYFTNNEWTKIKVKNKLFEKISKRDGKFCKYCNSTENLTIDHIISRSKKGKHTLNNLQILCRYCNSRKSNK